MNGVEKIFMYSDLKKHRGFPLEKNIIKIEDGQVFYEIIFEYHDNFYKIENISLNLDKYNDLDYYFEIIKENEVKAILVEKVETVTYTWKTVEENDQILKKEIETINDELSKLSLGELGKIVNIYGKKHKGKTVEYIYNNDVDFIKWVKENPPKYSQFNEYVRKKERSRLALIYYLEGRLFLQKQAR